VNREFRAQVLAAAAAEPSPTRAAVNRRNKLISMIAAASGSAAFVIFAALMSHGELVRLGGEITPNAYLERSLWQVVATAGGALAIAAAALWLALGRGRSMLGRPRGWLLCGAVLIPLGLFAWKVASSIVFGDALVMWPGRIGLRCLSLSLLVAIGPLLSFIALRRTVPVHPALNGAAMGVAAGACAWFAVDLWCPVAYIPHLLLGHVLPLVILAALGAFLGEALLSLRRR
jgi:hypothetical protein